MIRTFSEGITSLIFPPNCLVCRRRHIPTDSADILCPACLGKILLNHPPFCVTCTRPVHLHSDKCADCRRHPPHFDFAWCACVYDDFLKNLLLQFKYHHKTVWRNLFARLMIRFIEHHRLDIRQFECIIPMPLFPSRLRERGYNQSLLLARLIGRAYQIPVRCDILTRNKPTLSQSLLSEKDRWTNIRGAFRINPPYTRNYKKILIIDDLLTTGATASEAARTLKLSRVKLTGVLTLATAG